MLHSNGFTFLVFARDIHAQFDISTSSGGAFMKLTSDTADVPGVTVPAGTFTGCVRQVITVRPDLLRGKDQDEALPTDDLNPMNRGWKVVSYFGPDVGLVKVVQRDLNDNLLCTVELVACSRCGR